MAASLLGDTAVVVFEYMKRFCQECDAATVCDKSVCRVPKLSLRSAEIAQAVLEAAGVLSDRCIAPDVAKCVLSPHAGCDRCSSRDKAALARAGKEA